VTERQTVSALSLIIAVKDFQFGRMIFAQPYAKSRADTEKLFLTRENKTRCHEVCETVTVKPQSRNITVGIVRLPEIIAGKTDIVTEFMHALRQNLLTGQKRRKIEYPFSAVYIPQHQLPVSCSVRFQITETHRAGKQIPFFDGVISSPEFRMGRGFNHGFHMQSRIGFEITVQGKTGTPGDSAIQSPAEQIRGRRIEITENHAIHTIRIIPCEMGHESGSVSVIIVIIVIIAESGLKTAEGKPFFPVYADFKRQTVRVKTVFFAVICLYLVIEKG